MDATAFHAVRRFVPTVFGDIVVVERGAGAAALLLHGFPLNGFQWRGALERLSVHRRCIAPDLLGLGYTRVAKGQSLAPAAQASMLVALLPDPHDTVVDRGAIYFTTCAQGISAGVWIMSVSARQQR